MYNPNFILNGDASDALNNWITSLVSVEAGTPNSFKILATGSMEQTKLYPALTPDGLTFKISCSYKCVVPASTLNVLYIIGAMKLRINYLDGSFDETSLMLYNDASAFTETETTLTTDAERTISSVDVDIDTQQDIYITYINAQQLAAGTDGVLDSISDIEASIEVINSTLELKVSQDEVISRINLSTEGIVIEAENVDLSGHVTFSNLSTSGETSINGGNIQTDTITAAQILAGSITATEIVLGGIGTSSLAPGAVTNSILGTAAVTGAKIASGTVAESNLATGAVTNAKIAAGSIVNTHLTSSCIAAANIIANTITSDEIAANAITASEIAANAVQAVHILAGAITANEIAAGTITADEIALGAVTNAKIAAGSIVNTHLTSSCIAAANIIANTITSDEIAANAITASEIAANAIQSVHIVAGAITANEIAAFTISANEIATNAITSTKIAAGAISADKVQVTDLAAINANLGHITAGRLDAVDIESSTVTGSLIRTASTGSRLELYNDKLNSYNDLNQLYGVQIQDTNSFTSGKGIEFYFNNSLMGGVAMNDVLEPYVAIYAMSGYDVEVETTAGGKLLYNNYEVLTTNSTITPIFG